MAKPSISDWRWRPQLVLSTRLGKRFVALFILCALIPVVIFGLLADRAVSMQLRSQALARVQRSGKDASTAILQQFAALDERVASAIRLGTDMNALAKREPRFQRVDTATVSMLLAEQQQRVRAGKALLRVSPDAMAPSMQLVRWAPAPLDSSRIVVIGIDMRRVVGGVSGLDLVPPASTLCMAVASVSLGCVKAVDADDDETPLMARSTVFLRYEFGAPALVLTVAESDESAFATLARFRELFVPIAIGAVLLAALLAQITIRRQTAPLTALDAGTKRIASGDFSHQVYVDSDDEFGDLAHAFNGMTRQLNRQFNTLELHHDVDVAVLAATSRGAMIEVLLSRIRDVVSSERALMLVPPAEGSGRELHGWRLNGVRPNGGPLVVRLSETERAELTTAAESGFAIAAGGHRSYLESMAALRAEVFPVRVGGATHAALILGVSEANGLDAEDRHRVRQLAAQVAVAFSNLQLVDDLRALNSGALEALARTTDAASPWTAGHSVRVAAIAVALAQADRLDDDTVDVVRRGALLHDIGKLAVPVAILDKPAALTAEERAVMNSHPVVGVRILQPIAAFAPLLPMVRSHHERWDGTGYPDRLRGVGIHPLARLLAVADVAESMLAARPYRTPLPLEYVVTFIRDNAGTHFDPRLALLFAERAGSGDAALLAALAPSGHTAPEARLKEVA